jgi:hypothetical protein|tara:strand:+ start:553 stop:1059 length:507 start_codon:yes stop_codon:yes gene_type:complete
MSRYKDFLGLDLEKKQMKRCNKCKHYLSKSQFNKNHKGKQGLYSWCIDCNKKYGKENKEKNRRNKRNTTQNRSNTLYRKYGITDKQYKDMEREQNNKCAICEKPESRLDDNGYPTRLCVDHDHITGHVRGLLCSKCNLGIGYLMSDEGTDILFNAVIYIENHNLDHDF